MTGASAGAVPRWRLLLAFAAVYIVWGSTYLAIRYAIETIPPLLMAGTRFLSAGLLLFAWSLLRGARPPRRREWETAVVLGFLMLLIGNGSVTLAEQRITSGMAALLVGSEPVLLALLVWAQPGGRAPRVPDGIGMALGFAGVALLAAPWDSSGGNDPVGVGLVLLSALSWAGGSLYSVHAAKPESQTLANGMTMVAGGSMQMFAGVLHGEAPQVQWESVSAVSIGALLYLTVFGSMVAFSAYNYLLTVTTPAKASTHAFVNPVVAVLLGWAIAGEPLTARSVIAMSGIVAGVMLLTFSKDRRREPEVRANGKAVSEAA